jgi:hypothetical protein
LGGSGAAEASGAGALFVNPAALDIPGGFQAEAGMMRLSGGISPYGVVGSRGGPGTSYALGYFFDQASLSDSLTGPARQGLIGGGSWNIAQGGPGDALRSATLGAAAHTFGTEAAFGVDLDAGLKARMWDHAVFGLAVKNALQSGIGQKPQGYESPRRYLLSAGLAGRSVSAWKLRLREPEAFYEARASDFPPEGFVHAFSAGAAFIQDGVVKLKAAVLLPQEGALYFAGGFTLRLVLGPGLLSFSYAFMSGEGHEGDEPSHSFSFNFSSYRRTDRLAPVVSAQADRLELESDSGEAGWTHFHVSASDRVPAGEERISGETGDEIGRLREWVLTICAVGPDGGSRGDVRVFRGSDLPPRVIRWDGKNDSGSALPPGYYAYRFSAQDASGNQGVTAWQLPEIKAHRQTLPEKKGAGADSLDLGATEPGP